MKRLKAILFEQLSLVLDFSAVPDVTVRQTPQSDRRARKLVMGTGVVHYRLRRARRRSIGFQIDDDGLTISAPRWVTLREIEEAIVEKANWIDSKQREWRLWRERNRLPRVSFIDGAALPFLGTEIRIRLRAEAGATRLEAATGELQVALPTDAAEVQVRDAVQAWLQHEARRILGERVARFADRVGPKFAGWTLTSARSQWGSCTHDGRVRLNWRLIHFSVPVIDYVVAHELAHLHELNHSPRFWRRVEQLLPGFEAARDEIKGVDMSTLPL